jgi:hypothetical protein
VLGVAIAWASNTIETSSTISPAARAIWIIVLFLVWGAALGWVYHRMMHDEVATATGSATAPSAAEGGDRRRFLARFAGVATVVAVVAAAIGKVGGQREAAAPAAGSATHPFPHAGATVKPAPGTRSELTPVSQHYRIDINTSPPSISEASWRLKIHGLVVRPLEFTLADLRARPGNASVHYTFVHFQHSREAI